MESLIRVPPQNLGGAFVSALGRGVWDYTDDNLSPVEYELQVY